MKDDVTNRSDFPGMHEKCGLIHFLDHSPTVYHAARQIGIQLAEADFTPLSEQEKWELVPGKGYFVVRDEALVAAFRLPEKQARSCVILASHLDSPSLKIKPQPENFSQSIGVLNTEVYGSPLLHTWFDRDLAIAGRIVIENRSGTCESRLIFLDDDPVIIPSLALHLDRTILERGLQIQKQTHLRAIYTTSNQNLSEWLRKTHPFQKLLSFDLFLVPLQKASLIGFEKELLSSYRIDNLSSAHAAMRALSQANSRQDCLQMAIFWDHEEIGSKTYVGANSLFVDQILERILKMDLENFAQFKSNSFCISADVAHAMHPNFPEKYDLQNASFIGKGCAIKYSSKYATSAKTAAPLVHLAQKRSIPLQTFASHSDIPSGSTVGAMMAANLGISTVDLGVPCWAMHSTRETISVKDQMSLNSLLQAALEEELVFPEVL